MNEVEYELWHTSRGLVFEVMLDSCVQFMEIGTVDVVSYCGVLRR